MKMPKPKVESREPKAVGEPPAPITGVAAHALCEAQDFARVRSLTEQERGQMLIAACELASEIERSRLAAGMPRSRPAPWPASTWEFLRKHAANARS